jgi:hypothetical protein
MGGTVLVVALVSVAIAQPTVESTVNSAVSDNSAAEFVLVFGSCWVVHNSEMAGSLRNKPPRDDDGHGPGSSVSSSLSNCKLYQGSTTNDLESERSFSFLMPADAQQTAG